MGNCLRHETKAEWAGEDWTPAMMTDSEMKKGDDNEYCYSGSNMIKEVKVKITKKQLEELLGKMNVDVQQQKQGLSSGQILGKLVKVSVYSETTHHKSWRPRLQTIPEL
ncbi:uncharacterized protein [Spinacia oleracea]|uniref:Uncharacterized protein n=1 Tax=Spinacia oleracea TaxID=3562 RepID=A0A9R0J698_SPIOL|nr:uncharacterized protein LOC110799737 [Spinacia oleracea]